MVYFIPFEFFTEFLRICLEISAECPMLVVLSWIGPDSFFFWATICPFLNYLRIFSYSSEFLFVLFLKKQKIKIVIQTLCVSFSWGSIQRLRSPAMICLYFLQKIPFSTFETSDVSKFLLKNISTMTNVFDVVCSSRINFCFAEMNVLINSK